MDVFKIIVKRSSITKAEKLYKEGRLSIIYINSKPFYVEVINNASQFEARIWPTNVGYDGWRDGWIISASSVQRLIVDYTTALIDLQKEDAWKDSYIVEIREDTTHDNGTR